MTDVLTLGAPGVYQQPAPPSRGLSGVRMDVCAFVGVAPRGPAWVPAVGGTYPGAPPPEPGARALLRSVAVPVESWDEYRWYFGSFEGAGLLPHAVASFFEQGGTRAYVVRVVHDWATEGERLGATAAAPLVGLDAEGQGPPLLRARNEGAWGNGLKATLSYQVRPLLFEEVTTSDLVVDASTFISPGTLLRLTLPGGLQVLRFTTNVTDVRRRDRPGVRRFAALEWDVSAAPVRAEVVEATFDVEDTDPFMARRERIDRLGLSPQHPRWFATEVCLGSTLVYPDASWVDRELTPDVSLPMGTTDQFTGGRDRADVITPEDFFDPAWVLGDDDPRDGVHCLVGLEDLALVVTPDLYSPQAPDPIETILESPSLAGPTFAPCVVPPPAPAQAAPPQDLLGLRLDPHDPADRAAITALQARLVALVADLRSFVVLLDVPPGLHQQEILAWRAAFDSAFAAAYHPWLKVKAPAGFGDGLREVNPSAVAAGVLARREHRFGVWYGPANELAAGVLDVADRVSPAQHGELHQAGVNVYLHERDGIRLTAARTLSRDPWYRQLSVRRLVTMLERVLMEQMQWMVFEPNTSGLRADVRHLIGGFLRHLYRAGAFQGVDESEAFFVRCDETLNPPSVVDRGQLIAEVGVAPAEPLEFLVLRIDRGGDGTFWVEASRG